MAMKWDSVLVGAVARELREELSGARLQGHNFDWGRRLLTLFFRDRVLRWHLHPSAGWVVLEPPEDLSSEATPLAAEVRTVDAPRDERIVIFHLRKVRGRTRAMSLVVELMTNQWNALLLEGDERWIRHLLWTRRLSERALVSGQAYRFPPPSEREGILDDLSPSRWAELTGNPEPQERDRDLLDHVAFSSPINLPELLADGGFAFWQALRSGSGIRPCVLESNRGEQPYPYIIGDSEYSEYSSVLEAIHAVFSRQASGEAGGSAVADGLGQALRQARGRVRGLEREMTQAAGPETFRERANLLLARLGEVARGSHTVTLKGFDGQPVTLELDPALSPHENAQALYEEAARRERAMARLPTLLERAKARVAELEAMEKGLAEGTLSEGDVRPHLPQPKAAARWRTSHLPPRLPFHRFRSSGGLEIRVGRGSKDNDALTFKHSHPDDVWLHAREAGGAHVVLRWKEPGAPPARDLEEAACLAALNSKARTSQTVPVDWTRRKYVRKPRKAPAGTVTLERAQTVFIEPDPELPGRLSWDG